MVKVVSTQDENLNQFLARHPRVELIQGESEPDSIVFYQGSWRRTVRWNSIPTEPDLSGLVELCDNNPMVCTDSFVMPSPAATLALVTLGPLIKAGLILEDPILNYSDHTSTDDVLSHLQREGWQGDFLATHDEADLGGVLALSAMVVVPTLNHLTEFDELYDECYGRSFYINHSDHWDTSLVAGKAHCLYRLRITVDEPHSLLTIQAMADRQGKLGAAGTLHALNVMAGFEESLGIE
ncbi:MAG: hypothetical protein MUC92_05270 [Fimbriimonadaceae bacterium]|jgi:hypothetical protein|nr:hypothetical protein [Fimbriimonadaceae bacterium]